MDRQDGSTVRLWMDRLRATIDIAVTLLPAVIIAIIGWLTRVTRDKAHGKELDIWFVVSSFLCALFAGIVTRLVLDAAGMSELAMSGLSGVAGYGAGALLDAMVMRTRRAILSMPGPGASDADNINKD